MEIEVLPYIRRDEITKVVKGDHLILSIGGQCLHQNTTNLNPRHIYAGEKMRLAARILLNMREQQNNGNLKLTDVLLPKHEKDLQKAALMTAGQTNEESLSSLSNTIKLKQEVRTLAMTKRSEQCREELKVQRSKRNGSTS